MIIVDAQMVVTVFIDETSRSVERVQLMNVSGVPEGTYPPRNRNLTKRVRNRSPSIGNSKKRREGEIERARRCVK